MAFSFTRPHLLLSFIGLVTISLLYLHHGLSFPATNANLSPLHQSLNTSSTPSFAPTTDQSSASTLSSPSSTSPTSPPSLPLPQAKGTNLSSNTGPPLATARIGLINLWHGSHLSPYHDAFFHTASFNADILSLLFINIDTDGSGCADPPSIATTAPNIHFICLTRSDFFHRIADYFCGIDFWNCSTKEAKQKVRQEVPLRGSDYTRDAGLTYRPLVLPAMKGLWPGGDVPSWVGWSDTDLMFGNLRTLLADVLGGAREGADIVTFTVKGSDQWRMYLRGQMTLFRTNAAIEKAYMQTEEWSSWEKWLDKFGLPEDVDDMKRGEEEGYWSSRLIDVMAEAEGPGKELRWLQMVGLQGGDQSMLSWVHQGAMVKSLYSRVAGLWEVPYSMDRTDKEFWKSAVDKDPSQLVSKDPEGAAGSVSVTISVSHVCPEHFIGSLDHRRCVYSVPNLPKGQELRALSYHRGKVEIITMPKTESGRSEKLFQHFLWVKHNEWMRVPDFGVQGSWRDEWVYEVDAWGQTRLWDYEDGGRDVDRGMVEGHY